MRYFDQPYVEIDENFDDKKKRDDKNQISFGDDEDDTKSKPWVTQ